MITNPPHPVGRDPHPTIAESGRCPYCRAFYIGLVADQPYAFAVGFPAADALAVVRQPSPNHADALDTAWAAGCNPGGPALIMAVPIRDIERAEILMFTLLTGADADAAAAELGLTITRGEPS